MFKNPAAEFVYVRTYSKWLEEQGRRENWDNTVSRFTNFIFEERPNIPNKVINKIHLAISHFNVMPSMRALWASGPAAKKDNTTLYNCSFLVLDSPTAFAEMFYILMCGTGVGFSVQKEFVDNLPIVPKFWNDKREIFVIEDSREAWADSIKNLIEALYQGKDVEFDYSKIRPKGSRLVTMGGRASGPAPLITLHNFIAQVFANAQGRKLTTLECHDIANQIADSVVVGGVRRSSQISLSDLNDEEMRNAKIWPFPPRRFMANNSAVYIEKPVAVDFLKEWSALASSGTGERGIFNLESAKKNAPKRRNELLISGTNPCVVGETEILTRDGYKRIDQLVDQKVDIWNGFEWSEVIPKITGHNQPIVKIKTINGKELKCTLYHKFYLMGVSQTTDYILAKNLKLEDQLMQWTTPDGQIINDEIVGLEKCAVADKVYCFNESKRHLGIFNGVITGQCGEISLRDKQFCNLSEVIIRAEDDLDSLLEKVETATWLGVIQSSFTYFPYLSQGWMDNCNEERLLGVSLTGQLDAPELLSEDVLKALKSRAQKVSKKASAIMNINSPTAITCVKPSGCRPWDALTTTSAGILTLEELFEEHVDGNTWSDFNKNTEVLCEDESLKITKTYCNGLSNVHEITMTYGLSVQSTPNHKWFVVGEKTGKGMKGILPINQWMETKDIKEKHVIQVIPNLYNCEKHTRLAHLNSRSIKMRSDCDEITQPDFLSEDLCWFLGYLWGDGAMSPGKYRVRFTDQHIFNLQKAQKVVKKIFNLDTVLNKASENRDAYTLDISSKSLWHWLIKNGVWKYFADKLDIIPICVRTSSKSDIISFIAGLIDSDGWCGISKENVKKATITTSYMDFAKHLQHVAWSVGICIGRSLNDKGENLQHTKEMYLMQISSISDPNSCKELIRHSTKMSRMENTASGRWFFEGDPSKILSSVGVVSSNKIIGQKETFDIEVEGKHQYFNGSVRSHNTVSQLVDSASGIHPRYAKHYIRRYRISATDPLCKMMQDQGIQLSPENGQEDLPRDKVSTWIVSFPVKAPENSITRNEMGAISQLEWYKKIQKNWCEHNASMTVYVKDSEWFEVGNWVYKNWDIINGVSFLPHDGGKYKQAPYEEVTEEKYLNICAKFKNIDYSQLSKYEKEDQTEGVKAYACTGDRCEII